MKTTKTLLAKSLLTLTLLALTLLLAITTALAETPAVGTRFTFGTYGGEAITWIVVDTNDSQVMAVAEKALDAVQYNSSKKNCAWADCDLRCWLNGVFLNTAFNQEEQGRLRPFESENGVYDLVSLLSKKELATYAAFIGGYGCHPTAMANSRGTYTGTPVYTCASGTCSWWLRGSTIGQHAPFVGASSLKVLEQNNPPTVVDNGVRPVICLQWEEE